MKLDCKCTAVTFLTQEKKHHQSKTSGCGLFTTFEFLPPAQNLVSCGASSFCFAPHETSILSFVHLLRTITY